MANHNKGQFVKGQVPWNKGKKGWLSGGKSSEHRFKKGHRPVNWQPVGSTRLTKDGYVEIKAQEGLRAWRLLHREVWKQHHGAYPPADMALVFIDGNKENCRDINNLQLITRQELLNRNSVHRLPKELKQVIQLTGVLRRKLNGK